MFAFVIYIVAFYIALKIIDHIIFKYYISKLNFLKIYYREELEEEPRINPLYNVTPDIYFVYYKLEANPMWNLIGQSYITYRYYYKFKESAEDYCQRSAGDDYYSYE